MKNVSERVAKVSTYGFYWRKFQVLNAIHQILYSSSKKTSEQNLMKNSIICHHKKILGVPVISAKADAMFVENDTVDNVCMLDDNEYHQVDLFVRIGQTKDYEIPLRTVIQ